LDFEAAFLVRAAHVERALVLGLFDDLVLAALLRETSKTYTSIRPASSAGILLLLSASGRRCRPARLRPPLRQHALSPPRHIQDGRGSARRCRFTAARARYPGPARDRRLGDADAHHRYTNAPAIMIGEKDAAMIREDAA
jgi:hypothetical protein